jgi:predicted TIM-barrel fold metal-dependent hydrolase
MTRICNDEMAEMVAKYSEKYIAAIANLPLNDMDAAVKEAERTITELNFKGIQIYSRVCGNPPSAEAMMPLYELMVKHDLPIWIHPMRGSEQPDFSNEEVSYNQLFSIFGR